MLELFGEVTGAKAVMWGPSMIGYGTTDYTYASGHTGTWFHIGFSPRKAAISLYGLPAETDAPDLYERFGKHRRGAGCVYVNGLKDINETVLTELIRLGWENPSATC